MWWEISPKGESILVPCRGRNWPVMPVSSRVYCERKVRRVSSLMFQVRLGAML
ncbi:hypothetical protein D3C84_1038340 [compost metagenome]